MHLFYEESQASVDSESNEEFLSGLRSSDDGSIISQAPSLSISMSTVGSGGNVVASGATAHQSDACKPKRKREKLDHLSYEEKLMRRKMKNRISAQSARDRKKNKMMDLQQRFQLMSQEKLHVLKENEMLRLQNEFLERENAQLRHRLEVNRQQIELAGSSITSPEVSSNRVMCKVEQPTAKDFEAYMDTCVNSLTGSYTAAVRVGQSINQNDKSGISIKRNKSGIVQNVQEKTNHTLDSHPTTIETAELISDPQQKDQVVWSDWLCVILPFLAILMCWICNLTPKQYRPKTLNGHLQQLRRAPSNFLINYLLILIQPILSMCLRPICSAWIKLNCIMSRLAIKSLTRTMRLTCLKSRFPLHSLTRMTRPIYYKSGWIKPTLLPINSNFVQHFPKHPTRATQHLPPDIHFCTKASCLGLISTSIT